MYTIAHYGNMLADPVRMNAYRRAMARAIRPGSVVVDIGCGPGAMALLACELGAARVYAIEPDDSIGVAIALARTNSFNDRIKFFQRPAESVELPERADVIVSDLRGTLPMHGAHFAAIAHARTHWLKPGGVQIPSRDVLQAALVSDARYYARICRPWRARRAGIDLAEALKWRLNLPERAMLKPRVLATPPRPWATLDYRVLGSDNVSGRVSWSLTSSRIVHGIALWFDAELMPGIGFSNSPRARPAIYGQLLLPLARPLALRARDEVEVQLSASRREGDYGWRWITEVRSASASRSRRLMQDSFLGRPIGPDTLSRLAAASGTARR